MPDPITLGSVCSLIVDCEHKTAPPAEAGHEYGYLIGTPNIRNGRLLLSSAKRVDKPTFDAWTERAVPQKDDIILTREAPAGEAALVDRAHPFCLGQRTVLLRPDPGKVNARYLLYAIIGPKIQHRIRARSEGSTVAHLNVFDIRRLSIGQLPNPCKQAAIAAVLGALDDKIAVNTQVAETSLNLALARYEISVRDRNLWNSIPLIESARWFSGGTPQTSEPSYWEGEIPWISALSLKSSWIDCSDRRVTELGVRNGTRVVPRDTVIFVVRGSSLDSEFRIGITQCEVAFGQDCKALQPKPGIDPAVLFTAIKSRTKEILRLVDHAGHGAGRLATDLLGKVEISVPEARYNSEISVMLRPLIEIGAKRQAENRCLTQLRDILLPKLMSGESRIRDAERVVEEAT
jgi:type I restriction enzyme S subunit